VGDEGRRIRLGQDVLEIRDPEARVDRDVDGADTRHCEHREHPLRTVVEPEADLLPGLDAEMDQAPGEPIDLVRHLAERVPTVAEGEGLAVTEAARGLPRQVAEGEARGPAAVEISIHGEVRPPLYHPRRANFPLDSSVRMACLRDGGPW
jgi:hypothetical protein